MPFGNIKIKMEHGGHRITDRISARAFLQRLSLADRKKVHWQLVERALREETRVTATTEARAGMLFRDAAKAEGWLDE